MIAPSTAHTRHGRTAEISERTDTLTGSPVAVAGANRRTATIAGTASTASIQNGPRHPVNWPAKVPNGTPATTDRLNPPDITANARALAPGPATAAATTAPVAQNVPVASAVRTREAVTTVNESLTAATTCPA